MEQPVSLLPLPGSTTSTLQLQQVLLLLLFLHLLLFYWDTIGQRTQMTLFLFAHKQILTVSLQVVK